MGSAAPRRRWNRGCGTSTGRVTRSSSANRRPRPARSRCSRKTVASLSGPDNVAPALPQSPGLPRDGTGSRASDPCGLRVDRQQRTRGSAALPAGDRRRLRKSDVKSDVADARRRPRRAASSKGNSRIVRECELYGCSDTPGRDRTCDLRFRKPSLYPLSYEGKCVFPQKNKGFFAFASYGRGRIPTRIPPFPAGSAVNFTCSKEPIVAARARAATGGIMDATEQGCGGSGPIAWPSTSLPPPSIGTSRRPPPSGTRSPRPRRRDSVFWRVVRGPEHRFR